MTYKVYDRFRYIYPPRAKNTLPADRLARFDDGRWLAQPKYNGSCTPVFLPGNGDSLVYNRHNEPIQSFWFPKMGVDFKAINQTGKYMVVCGELMNKAKMGENGKPLIGFVIWDILVLEGIYLIGETFEKRMSLLEQLYPTQHLRTNGQGKVEELKHLGVTSIPNVYRSPVYVHKFADLYQDIVQTDAYEGMVLKRAEAKLDFGYNESNNFDWQFKIRKATKNYKY